MAKEFFETYELPFTDYNVAIDLDKRKEMLEKSGQMGVPVIVIDGKDIIVGFDRDFIASTLGIEG